MYRKPSLKTDFSTCQSFASSGRMSTSRAAAPSSPVPVPCTAARSRCPTSDPARRSWSRPSAPTGQPCSTTSITSTVATRKSWASSKAWVRTSPASRAKMEPAMISPGSSGIEPAVLSKKIGIDLGTSTVLVYVKGEGVVVNEPSVMATDEKGGRVLAVGRAAAELAVIGHGETLAIESLRIGGDAFDRAIDAAIGNARGVRLMPGEAERLKIQLGSASGPVPDTGLEVSAVDEGGARSTLRVSGNDVQAAS